MRIGGLPQPPRRRLRWQNGSWVVLFLFIVWLASHGSQTPAPVPAQVEGTFRVERAVDGDTLKLTNHARVRLIGVNAPETVKPDYPVEPFGPEASAYTHKLCDGQEVRLQFDR